MLMLAMFRHATNLLLLPLLDDAHALGLQTFAAAPPPLDSTTGCSVEKKNLNKPEGRKTCDQAHLFQTLVGANTFVHTYIHASIAVLSAASPKAKAFTMCATIPATIPE
jgi:hypothetical protein